jgi:hypothetical protein
LAETLLSDDVPASAAFDPCDNGLVITEREGLWAAGSDNALT